MILCDQIQQIQAHPDWTSKDANSATNVNPLQWEREREHKQRMLSTADNYLQQHVNLNFMYIGQLVVRREIWNGAVTCSQQRGRAPNSLASVFRYPE